MRKPWIEEKRRLSHVWNSWVGLVFLADLRSGCLWRNDLLLQKVVIERLLE